MPEDQPVMVSRGRHPKKPIADVVQDGILEVEEVHKGHRWGVLICSVCGTRLALWSRPRVPEDTAKQIYRFAARHMHEEQQP